jgi:predicted permease
VSWAVEFAPGAAREFRSLPRGSQRSLADRIAHLESGGPPVGWDDAGASVVVVPAGDYRLVCVPLVARRTILIAGIEPAELTWGALAGAWLRRATLPVRGIREVGVRGSKVHGLAPGNGDRVMDWLGEVALAFRALRRRPGIVALAVVALGLGIGLPASIYSVLEGAFLRGLPFEEGRRILHLERRPQGATGEGWGVEARDFVAWRESQTSFESLGAFRFMTATLRDGSGAVRYGAAEMTANAFGILRVRAALGRTFEVGDDQPGADPVVVLSQPVWRDRFGADAGVIGQVVRVDGVARTVVGVMPEGFRFPNDEDLWIPLVVPASAAEGDGIGSFDVFGRLRDGVSRADAEAEFAVIATRMAARYPDANGTMGVAIKPFTERYMGETATAQSWFMLGAVLLVLLVASVNVANLQLVRAVERLRDLAVRTALGASRLRIIRQLLFESGAIALLGGIVGVGVAAVAMAGLGWLFPPHRMPFWFELRLDVPVLLFVTVLCVAAALLAGILPALRASGRDLHGVLNDDSRGATGVRVGRLMQGLVVLEIAFSLGLLVTAGLALVGVGRVQPERLGMAVDGVVTARVSLPSSYTETERRGFWEGLIRVLSTDGSIREAVVASDLPAEHASVTAFMIEGREYAPESGLPRSRYAVVSDGLWSLYGRTVTRGRGFGPGDTEASLPVVVVNERFARVRFPGEDPIGRRIRVGDDDTAPWRTVVGIAPDLWANGLDSSPDRNPPGLYLPLAQAPPAAAAIAIRGPEEAAATAVLRAAAFGLEPDAPVYEVRTMTALIEDNSWFFGMAGSILAGAGLVALVLATVGLYGVIAFSVGRRTREIGIRMAFGAGRASILALVLRRGIPAVALGMAAGFLLAFILANGISSLLFGVDPTDPRVFAAVGGFLALVALTAILVPARRAASVDPLEALRTE